MYKVSLRILCASVIALSVIALSASSSLAQTQTIRFAAFGDYGVNNSREQAVADLVDSWNPDFLITTGDNSYGSTAIDDNVGKYYSQYMGAYSGSYGAGSVTNEFFPSIGNHGYSDGGGINAYLNYFTLPGAGAVSSNTSGNERYYDFVKGPVHFFALNSNSQESDGRSSSSAQAQWLQAQLAASTAKWKIVYMHHPPYSSARHGSQSVMQWPFEDWGVTAVLAGHDHTYERIHRDDNSDSQDFPYFVTGFGGRTKYDFPASNLVAGSVVRYNSDNGSMLIDADEQQIIFRFYSVAGGPGGTLIDSFAIVDVVTDVGAEENVLPGGFTLNQNYPNPFNPTTVISYSLPVKSEVTVTIYNLLGQSVRVFRQGEQSTGEHSISWDATDASGNTVASGVYFYRLTSGDFAVSRKMVLLR